MFEELIVRVKFDRPIVVSNRAIDFTNLGIKISSLCIQISQIRMQKDRSIEVTNRASSISTLDTDVDVFGDRGNFSFGFDIVVCG